MRLIKGDTIIVTMGKDKGRRGKIDKVFIKDSRILVPGINVYKHHVKKKNEKNPGGRIEIAHPLSVAKVALVCPKCSKATRIGFSLGNKEKHRMCRKCKQLI